MKNTLILIMALLLCTISFQTSGETKTHITTGFTPPVSNFFSTVFKEIEQRLPNISISTEVLPAERSLVLSNQAVTDGECCRIPEVVGINAKTSYL